MGSIDGAFDGFTDGNLEGLLRVGSLGYNDDNVLGTLFVNLD